MSEWLQINSIEMLVSKAEFELDISKSPDLLYFSCDLLNIARGRCDILFKKVLNNEKNYIFIGTDKPVMNSEINLSDEKFNDILNTINKLGLKMNKKIKVVLYLNKSLAVNNDGFLSIDKDIKLEVINIKIIMPII